MNVVFRNKVRTSVIMKVASRLVLAIFAIAFFAAPLAAFAKAKDTNEQVNFVGVITAIQCSGSEVTNCTNKIDSTVPKDLSKLVGKLIETKMENRLWFSWVSKVNDDGQTVQAMVTVYPLNNSQKKNDLKKAALKGYLGKEVTVDFNQ